MNSAGGRAAITISRRTSLAAVLGLFASASAQAQPTMLDPVATQVSAGNSHSCALTAAGGVKCWGNNSSGQLGDGTTTQRLVAVNAVGLESGVVQVAAGLGPHACALTTNGVVKCWGANAWGQLGDGTTSGRLTAVETVGLGGVVATLSAGAYHTCALTTEGGVKCWGNNVYGQLGDGTQIHRSTPVDVTGLTNGVVSIAAGEEHTCALTKESGMKCWGRNASGRLGDGTTQQRSTPVSVVGLSSGVSGISAGGPHTCAVLISGGAKCWGSNQFGQLGDGTTSDRLTPASVIGLEHPIRRVVGGFAHSCAVNSSGGVKCWGNNTWGQLGNGSSLAQLVPVNVLGLPGPASGLTAGAIHTCVTSREGGVQCWGANQFGGLGDGTTIDRLAPVHVAGLAGAVSRLSAGEAHTCALTPAGGVKCTGHNQSGSLGDGTTTDRLVPVDVSGLPSGVASVATGGFHTCAVTTSGGLKCWGLNTHRQLGDGTTVNFQTLPVNVPGLASGVASAAAGATHTCIVTNLGGVKCWGGNASGQLGDGTTVDRPTPVDVLGLTSGVTHVAAAASHSCALMSGGGVKCWGGNSFGQIGDGTTTSALTPTDVFGFQSGATGISVGTAHTCAANTAGGLKCWGRNEYGELGDGTTTNRSMPVDVSGLDSSVASGGGGYFHHCAVVAGGAKCWGFSQSGQLGDGTFAQRLTPVDVLGLAGGVARLAAGIMHTCALKADGGVKCWGNNGQGRLGDGTAIARTSPVAIRSGQSIAFIPPVSLSPGGPIPFDATSSSGLPVIFDTWTPWACSIVGNSVVAGAAALCGIRASQAGDFNHAPAPQQLHLVPILTPTISIADVTLPEGNSGTINAVFTVTLSAPSPQTVTVSAITSDQSATAGSDYSATGPQTLTFPPTTTTQTFSVPVSGDALLEGDETFLVTLSNPTNALIADAVAVGTIANDEPPSRVFVSSSGSDAANCSIQATPCRNLAAAIGQVAPDGEVIVLFSGEYHTAPLMIDNGLKITPPTGTVALLRHPILVNAPGGRVVLRGLTLKGGGAGTAVLLTAADSLSIEDTSIEGWGGGLKLANAAASRVSVLNAVFRANTSGILDGGGAPGNRVSIVEARFEGNTSAIEVNAGGFTVRESMFAGNATGVSVGAGTVEIRGAAFAFNGTAVAALSGGTVGISRSWIFGNSTGLSAAGGSVLNSAGTNVIRGNLTDTTGTITSVPEQ